MSNPDFTATVKSTMRQFNAECIDVFKRGPDPSGGGYSALEGILSRHYAKIEQLHLAHVRRERLELLNNLKFRLTNFPSDTATLLKEVEKGIEKNQG